MFEAIKKVFLNTTIDKETCLQNGKLKRSNTKYSNPIKQFSYLLRKRNIKYFNAIF